jgi:outer membrane protein assembly factor BamE
MPRTLSIGALCAFLAIGLAGCRSWIPESHVPPLQQGNVVEQEAVAKLKPGMTRAQVRFLLGTPLIVDPFRENRWDYVYTHKRQGEPLRQRRLTVIFDGDQLVRLEGDVVAAAGTPSAAAAPAPRSAAPPAVPAGERGFFGRMLERIGL